MYKLGSINNNHYISNNMNNNSSNTQSSNALSSHTDSNLTPPPYQVPASECSSCGKFKVLINHTQYVLNGREAKDGQPHLWVEETPQGALFSIQPTPNSRKWKIISSKSVLELR